MTRSQIQIELKNEFLALSACQNATQRNMAERRIQVLKLALARSWDANGRYVEAQLA